MLIDEIKARMFKAMKAGNIVEKEILRVAMGELTTEAARPGRNGSDEEAQAILRKLIKSNEESLGQSSGRRRAEDVLRQEIEVLAALLAEEPRAGRDRGRARARSSRAIKAAGNDGQATGVAMKHLKASRSGGLG